MSRIKLNLNSILNISNIFKSFKLEFSHIIIIHSYLTYIHQPKNFVDISEFIDINKSMFKLKYNLLRKVIFSGEVCIQIL